MKKIVGFIVCTMLITATGFSVIGIEEDNEDELNDYLLQKQSEIGEQDLTEVWIKMNPNFVGGVFEERMYVGMAFDASANRTILWGGSKSGIKYNDTWAYNYNNNTWVNRTPSYSGGTLTSRSTQSCIEIAYDSDAQQVILFGGYDGSTIYNETWAYNYADNMWVNMSPSVFGGNLTPRVGVMMAYYDSVDRMIMFGGAGFDVYYNETWAYNYDANNWINRNPTVIGGSLPSVLHGDMVYDSTADCIILLGGRGEGSTEYNETWVYCYSNNTWWKRNPSFVGGTLTPRESHGMVYDSGANRTILFGGGRTDPTSVLFNDTWEYDYSNNTWYKFNYDVIGGDFEPREDFGMVYDSRSDKAIVACGFCESPLEFMNDTWVFKHNAGNEPPFPPTNPVPANRSLNVDIDTDLGWYCWDIDMDDLTYDVYFEANDSTPDVKVSSNQTQKFFNLVTLDYNTTYYWQIIAWEPLGNSTAGPVWHFTTMEFNNPPNTPSNPEPEDGATDVDINADLSWECSDPDGDDLIYDVYFEANDPTPDELVSNNQSETTYDPGEMEYDTHYYWKIVAWDPYNYTEGPVWDFTTGINPNNPPYVPSDPEPENDSTNVDVDSDLSWVGGDPDDDPVVYDVYFEAYDQTPDDKVADDITETTFDPGNMEYDTIYYWRIIAKDSHGASTWGPVWHFTTELTPVPDLDCEGSLNWTNVKPGKTVEGSLTVRNIGDPGTMLDWEIVENPEWGTWNFLPSSGDDLTPEDEPVTVTVTLTAPDEKNSEFDGEVKIVNQENPSDFCIIDASLTTPKNKVFNFFVNILMWLFERFPNAFPILRYMLGL